MHITCPNCGQHITSDYINIQQMVAVCPACSHVFTFAPSTAKTKRRKVKQPTGLMTHEGDKRLEMAFHTNTHLMQNESFISALIGAGVFTLVVIVSTGAFINNGESVWLPLIFGALAVLTYYWLLLIAFNKTHIVVDEDSIYTQRRPIPDPLTEHADIALSQVVRVYYEETPTSRQETYATPRYHVWVERTDGNRQVILRDMVGDYAAFIVQGLEAYLHPDPMGEASPFVDDDFMSDDTHLTDYDVDDDAYMVTHE